MLNKELSVSVILSIVFIPFLFLVMIAFGNAWVFPEIFPGEWSLANANRIMVGNSEIGISLLRSLLISAVVSLSGTFVGFFISREIARSKFRKLLSILAYFPFVLSPVILALSLHVYFIRFGLSGNTGGIIFAQLLMMIPYSIIFFLGFWDEKVKSLEQLVETLGGGNGVKFKRVLFPMAKPMIIVCVFQTFLISWFEYGLTNYIGVGKVKTLTILVFHFINEANPYFAAFAALLLVIPPISLLLLNKHILLRRSITNE